MAKLTYKDLGIIDYQQAWDYQLELFQGIIDHKKNEKETEKPDNVILFCEHPHVYTLGKSGQENNLLINHIQLQAKNAAFYKIDRGGDITYHGPGQIVGYPIIDLEDYSLSVKRYVNLLEESIILTLKNFGIIASRLEGATGVWLDPQEKGKARKICAIGIKASRYVTMHGFAFNVNTDLTYFNHINPCGFIDKGVTSLSKELNTAVNFEDVKIMLKDILIDLIQSAD